MFERNDLKVLKKEAKAGAKELARLGALEAKRAKRAAALAKKEAEAAARERDRREAVEISRTAQQADKETAKRDAAATRERWKQEVMEVRKAQAAAAKARKEAALAARENARQDAKESRERAKQEAMQAKKAEEAAALAKIQAEKAAKDAAKQEALQAKMAKETAALAKKQAEKAAEDKAKQDALQAKTAKEAAALAKSQAEKAAKDAAKQEVLQAKMAKAAALAKKQAEKEADEKARQEAAIAREKARQEVMQAKKTKEADVLAQKVADKEAKEKTRQEAEAAMENWRKEVIVEQKAEEAAALAQKQANKDAKEKARQAAEAAREKAKQEALQAKMAKAAALAKKQAEKEADEKARKEAAIAREKARQAAMEAKRVRKLEIKAQKARQPAAAMIPIFNWRTITVVVIGLIVGAGLGLGYWIISPSFSLAGGGVASNQVQPSGLAGMIGTPPDSPYQSVADVQLVSPGVSYLSIDTLRQRGEYYTVKANSLPFFKFLSQELNTQAPQYSHAVDQLNQMISITFDYKSQLPAIQIAVKSPDSQEASFIAGFVPQTFEKFLITEETDKQQLAYENTLKAIENYKVELLKAEEELNVVKPVDAEIFNDDPAYIALNAKITALELELDRQATEQATMTAIVDVSKDSETKELEYQRTLEAAKTVNIALSEAEQELQTLKLQQAAVNNVSNNAAYITLNAKIKALEAELDRQMTGYTEVNSIGQEKAMPGLAQMIALGITSGPEYADTVKRIESTSVALSEARKELTVLGTQSSDTGSEGDLDYRLAQGKVNSLNKQLAALSEKLNLLADKNTGEDNHANAQVVYARTSAALAEARAELAKLKSQAGGNRSTADPNYEIARAKVTNLTAELTNLVAKMSSSLANNINTSEVTGYLVAGNPSIPTPVLPERARARNVLIMGAVIGIGGGWLLLNRRWVAKGMPSSRTDKAVEDGEK